jgi:putative hydrolase of the HAD superfamily
MLGILDMIVAANRPGCAPLAAKLSDGMGSARVVFWDFDGTLARRGGLWSGALRDALGPVAPGTEVALGELRAELSRGLPWHSPEIVVPPRSADDWWMALRPVFLDAYETAGGPRDLAQAAANRVAALFYRADV